MTTTGPTHYWKLNLLTVWIYAEGSQEEKDHLNHLFHVADRTLNVDAQSEKILFDFFVKFPDRRTEEFQ